MTRYKKSRLFGAKIEPACYYCELGNLSHDNRRIMCKKKGFTSPFFSCKSFVYAPLKRVPKKQPRLGDFTYEDFKL